MTPLTVVCRRNNDHTVAGHLRRHGPFGRLILTDPLGAGSSDPAPVYERPAMQGWTDGLVGVLDAADCKRATVFTIADQPFRQCFWRQVTLST